jgi:hypothetical protein
LTFEQFEEYLRQQMMQESVTNEPNLAPEEITFNVSSIR